MIRVQVRETIGCTPDEILEFVMDIERYAAEVDDKIRPVTWARRDGNLVEFECRPKLAGVRQPKVVQQVRLIPGRRIDISMSPPPRNRLQHAIARFDASFECAEADGGATLVTRTLTFRVTPAMRWLVEPLLRRRLPAEVREEVRLAKQHLERRSADPA
ncbi:SRPBCC family protein [Pseudonocardia acaciae]|uniref:SRPBCC family protein n=1 Tax=Pseudonocardia acaciae TaxID=551276 RepID=UPI00048A7C16|nr:SRPBCC family protein [Pseudonocardia acaciae]